MSIKERYFIKKISYEIAEKMIAKNHYLHRMGPTSFAFGLYETGSDFTGLFPSDKLVGVITYGTPAMAPLRMGICGKDEKDNVIELTRVWIEDGTPKNVESFLIGNTIKKVDKEIIVSFAEIQAGHIGTIYQATNWIYTGLSAKRTNWTIEGINKHSQTIADKYTSVELKEICGDKFTLVDRPRKHRYIYFNCKAKRKKELLLKLKYNIECYPKKILKKPES